jgi:YHS domain-containing protein
MMPKLPLSIIGRNVNQSFEALKHLMSFRDPVCGMVLNEDTAKFKITYEGETYHFCSLVCKKRFKRHATKFVK